MLTLIDFYADWCGPCKIMEPIFAEIKKTYEGKISFKKVDVETGAAEASKYGVMGIPTFILLNGDKEIARKVGAMPKDVLTDWLDSNLK